MTNDGTTRRTTTKAARKLTTLQAAEIARKLGVRGLCIYRDDLDRDLWRIVTPGRNQAHEPMDEPTWRAFLKAFGWIERPRRLDAGKGRRVTVPDNDENDMFEALREELSPHAVASIAAHLQGARTNNQDVDREVRWFAEQLAELLGGYKPQAQLAEELGL